VIDFASVAYRARIVSASAAHDAPNDFPAMLTPLLDGGDPVSHYSAAFRPLPQGQSEDWFVLELPRERRIETLEIDWCRADLAGCEFVLEAGDGRGNWTQCLREEAGYQRCRRAIYRRDLDGAVVARFFRFHLFRSLGQNRLLIRRFSLLGPGPAPRRVLMLAPDCYNIDRRILQEARSLIEAGYRVTLLCGFECPKEEHYFEDGIEIHRCVYDWDDERIKGIRGYIPTRWLRLLFHRAFIAYARRFSRYTSFETFIAAKGRQFQADIVHVHDLPILKAGAALASEWNVPLVFDAHEIYHETHLLPLKTRRKLLAMEKRLVPELDLFITVNDGAADFFRGIHGPDTEILVLYNSADENRKYNRARSRQAVLKRCGLDDDPILVLYQGCFSQERNLDTLIRATAHFHEGTRLVLIGFGDYQEEMKRIVHEEGLQDRVLMLGRIESSELAELTDGVDIGIIPYKMTEDVHIKYCSPNKFFEFIQARVPMVVPDFLFFRQMRERYGEDIMHIADTSSVEGIARAVNYLIDNPARRARMRQACEENARSLSWETDGRKLLDSYRRILGPALGGSPA
jgi:glycosyltransferase involved in cell wall biosynthesis